MWCHVKYVIIEIGHYQNAFPPSQDAHAHCTYVLCGWFAPLIRLAKYGALQIVICIVLYCRKINKAVVCCYCVLSRLNDACWWSDMKMAVLLMYMSWTSGIVCVTGQTGCSDFTCMALALSRDCQFPLKTIRRPFCSALLLPVHQPCWRGRYCFSGVRSCACLSVGAKKLKKNTNQKLT